MIRRDGKNHPDDGGKCVPNGSKNTARGPSLGGILCGNFHTKRLSGGSTRLQKKRPNECPKTHPANAKKAIQPAPGIGPTDRGVHTLGGQFPHSSRGPKGRSHLGTSANPASPAPPLSGANSSQQDRNPPQQDRMHPVNPIHWHSRNTPQTTAGFSAGLFLGSFFAGSSG